MNICIIYSLPLPHSPFRSVTPDHGPYLQVFVLFIIFFRGAGGGEILSLIRDRLLFNIEILYLEGYYSNYLILAPCCTKYIFFWLTMYWLNPVRKQKSNRPKSISRKYFLNIKAILLKKNVLFYPDQALKLNSTLLSSFSQKYR